MFPVFPSVGVGGVCGALYRQSRARVAVVVGKGVGTEDLAAAGEFERRGAGGGEQQWIAAVPGIELRHGSDVERVGVAHPRRVYNVLAGASPGAVLMRTKIISKTEHLADIASRSGNGGNGHGGGSRSGEVIAEVGDGRVTLRPGLVSRRQRRVPFRRYGGIDANGIGVVTISRFTAAACGECNNGQDQDRKFHRFVHGETPVSI